MVVPNVPVIIMSADNSWFTTSGADARGYFTFDSLKPGEYVIGINLPGAPDWKYAGGAGVGVAAPIASLYYNGAAPNGLRSCASNFAGANRKQSIAAHAVALRKVIRMLHTNCRPDYFI
jgi:hypothetical protein